MYVCVYVCMCAAVSNWYSLRKGPALTKQLTTFVVSYDRFLNAEPEPETARCTAGSVIGKFWKNLHTVQNHT
jgi:hypothetical protein